MSVTAMATEQPTGKTIFSAMQRFSRQNARQTARMAADDYQNYLRDLDEAGYKLDPETQKPRKKAAPKRAPVISEDE